MAVPPKRPPTIFAKIKNSKLVAQAPHSNLDRPDLGAGDGVLGGAGGDEDTIDDLAGGLAGARRGEMTAGTAAPMRWRLMRAIKTCSFIATY